MMKKLIYTFFVLPALILGACTKMEDVIPEGGTLLASQLTETVEANPLRSDAAFIGMYTKLGQPGSVFGDNHGDGVRPDDFGFIMCDFSNDVEAADVVLADNDYNWFSPACDLTSRNADYANPYIRYACCYNEITAVNDVLKLFPENSDDPEAQAKIGQAYAIRAYSYLRLAPYFQFSYELAADQPCVPIVTLETNDFTNNPRASVDSVYKLIIIDLTTAIEKLKGYNRPDKGKVDQQVAYGLRARAYLYMGKWNEALADAKKAAQGYTPASIEEVSHPNFMNINEHNWIWGYDMTTNIAASVDGSKEATSSSWIRSFSANSYSSSTGTYARINKILYDKISSTDVRKGWWVDENLHSPLLNGLKWDELEGQDIARGEIENVKLPFDSYTNVKFGTNSIGTTLNDEDWPFMRVEEMILIQAECYARIGNTAMAQQILTDFVKRYRDPNYNINGRNLTLENEIWFQRRIELWGEGFSNADTRRLNKPLVRFVPDKPGNFPEAFRFNMTADDGWWLLRFCTDELNTNFSIVNNKGGALPVKNQHPELRDGVTD